MRLRTIGLISILALGLLAGPGDIVDYLVSLALI